MSAAFQILGPLFRHGRKHKRYFVWGCLAALFLVAARLAMPWPVHALMEHLKGKPAHDLPAFLGPLAASIDPPILYGLEFFLLLVCLGLGDGIVRLQFARFSIATVRDLRERAFHRSVESSTGGKKTKPGDTVARLIGDTARLKAGMKGFLVHVATNIVLFVGVTVVLLSVNLKLGLVFAAAGTGTTLLTWWGASRIFRKTRRYRKKEGKLANEMSRALRKGPKKARFKRLNRKSGRHEAYLTKVQSMTTGGTYCIFGLAVILAVWLGARDIAAGRLDNGGMLVFLLYALTIRGPMVRLARQGSRLGKIFALAERVGQLLSRPLPTTKTTDGEAVAKGSTVMHPESTPEPLRGGSSLRVLFTGYAPVHFLCFQPLWKRLVEETGVETWLSGGLRSETEQGRVHDHMGLYMPFGVPEDRVLSVEELESEDFDVVFAANTKIILPRSVGKKVQIFHGISFRNRAVRSRNMDCDHYFLVGPYMQRRFHAAGLLDEGDPRGLKIGFMKTDRLINGELDRDALLADHGFDGSRPVLLYAPTGQKRNSLESMGEEVLERLSATGAYDILVKLHDHPKDTKTDWFGRLARFESDHCKIARDLDVIPLLFLADLLISDASSVTSEYSLLDRPMVFLDVPRLLAKAEGRKGSMLDLDTWGRKAGAIVTDPATVVDAVDTGLEGIAEHAEVRRAMARDLFFNPGSATDAALDWVRESLLGSYGQSIRVSG